MYLSELDRFQVRFFDTDTPEKWEKFLRLTSTRQCPPNNRLVKQSNVRLYIWDRQIKGDQPDVP